MSYRSNIVFLPRAVAKLSPSLRLESTRLFLRHTLHVGQPAIEVTLTSSGREVCEWLGLEWSTFGVFDTEADLYRWLTDVPFDSPLGAVWQMVLRGEAMPKKYGVGHATRKTEGWDMLADWIQANVRPSNTSHASLAGGSVTRMNIVDQITHGELPLDMTALAALERWCKVHEYEEKLRTRMLGRRT